jgi:prolyl-tRNA synthetase
VHSYRQLPVTLYQIQTKFRDEMRPRFGVVRACEFIMKDAYSFDQDWEGLKVNYQKMYDAYVRIFERCNLKPVIVEADSGAMGGDVSHEFLVPAEIGEDQVKDASGQDVPAIELGHIFQLGTKYSEALGAMYLDAAGKQNPIIMGCYGIGVSRFLATIIEVHHDDKGIMWPKEVAPFHVELLPVQISDEEAMRVTDTLYGELTGKGWDVLVDDRDETAGRKFNDADLIGIPIRVTMGKRGLKEGKVEISERATGQVDMVAIDQAAAFIHGKLAS